MPTITLPQIGKATVGTVRRWRKKTGEVVHKGDIILEIETDDGLVEVESPIDGTLGQILVGEGKTAAIKTPIAVIGEDRSAPPCSSVNAENDAKPAVKEVKVSSVKPVPAGKVIPIVMPKAGQSMEEGTLVKWHVQPGASIQKGQVIFEIETDKATMDVEATDSGRLSRIVLAEGQITKVLEPVAYLADNDADVDAFVAEGTGKSDQATERRSDEGQIVHSVAAARAVVGEGGRVKASPAARKVAGERGVDLAAVGLGSGPGGRILSMDVPLAGPAAPTAAAPAAVPVANGEGVTRRKMSKMRRAIAENLALSKRTIPHFYIRATVNAEPLMSFYQGEKAKYPCSINDVVVMACAKAIREFALLRSRIEGDEIVQFEEVNIGIAVGMEEGLVVPVVVNADQKSLKELGVESKRIATSAKAGKIEGMGKGLFTITNMGMLGVEEFGAIINPPESAILAVGAVREDVIVSGGTLRLGKVMTLTLSVDHRVIDGMLAARFIARLKELLEWPAQMM